jgi:hypothetical protein
VGRIRERAGKQRFPSLFLVRSVVVHTSASTRGRRVATFDINIGGSSVLTKANSQHIKPGGAVGRGALEKQACYAVLLARQHPPVAFIETLGGLHADALVLKKRLHGLCTRPSLHKKMWRGILLSCSASVLVNCCCCGSQAGCSPGATCNLEHLGLGR